MDAQWLRLQFKINPEKNKADLARALNLDPPAISKILNGARQIKAHEYMSMRTFFGLPNENDIASSRIHNRTVLQPLKTKAFHEAQKPEEQDQWIIPSEIILQKTETPPEKIKIFKVEDATMAPDFLRGEHVLIDTLNNIPSPPGAFLVYDGFGHRIRNCEYIAKSSPPQIKMTTSANPLLAQTLAARDLEIIGKVIAKLQWL